jgi:hypothetical protein
MQFLKINSTIKIAENDLSNLTNLEKRTIQDVLRQSYLEGNLSLGSLKSYGGIEKLVLGGYGEQYPESEDEIITRIGEGNVFPLRVGAYILLSILRNKTKLLISDPHSKNTVYVRNKRGTVSPLNLRFGYSDEDYEKWRFDMLPLGHNTFHLPIPQRIFVCAEKLPAECKEISLSESKSMFFSPFNDLFFEMLLC